MVPLKMSLTGRGASEDRQLHMKQRVDHIKDGTLGSRCGPTYRRGRSTLPCCFPDSHASVSLTCACGVRPFSKEVRNAKLRASMEPPDSWNSCLVVLRWSRIIRALTHAQLVLCRMVLTAESYGIHLDTLEHEIPE